MASRDITNILSGVDPKFAQQQTSSIAGNVADNTPVQKFNAALLDMLKRYQGLGTAKFQQAAITGQEQQVGRIQEQAQPGLAPSVQSSIRQAGVQAIQPQVTGAQEMGKTFGEQISGLGDILTRAQQFSQNYAVQQQKATDDARAVVNGAIGAGSKAVEALIKSQPDIIKMAGYNTDTLKGVIGALQGKEQREEQKLGAISAVVDPLTGQITYYQRYPDGSMPGAETPGAGTPKQGWIPPQIQAAIGYIGDTKFIDQTKLTERQVAIAQAIATQEGIPIIKLGENEDKSVDAFNKIDNVISQVENVYAKASPGLTGPAARAVGTALKYGQGLGLTDPSVREYESLVNANIGPIARAVLGEVGVLTDRDVERARSTLPSLTDTPEEARRKIANMRQLVEANRQGFFKRIGVVTPSKQQVLQYNMGDIVEKPKGSGQFYRKIEGGWEELNYSPMNFKQ